MYPPFYREVVLIFHLDRDLETLTWLAFVNDDHRALIVSDENLELSFLFFVD